MVNTKGKTCSNYTEEHDKEVREHWYQKTSKHTHKKDSKGNSLAVQWLGLHASTSGSPGLIPGQGTKIPQAAQCSQK